MKPDEHDTFSSPAQPHPWVDANCDVVFVLLLFPCHPLLQPLFFFLCVPALEFPEKEVSHVLLTCTSSFLACDVLQFVLGFNRALFKFKRNEEIELV